MGNAAHTPDFNRNTGVAFYGISSDNLDFHFWNARIFLGSYGGHSKTKLQHRGAAARFASAATLQRVAAGLHRKAGFGAIPAAAEHGSPFPGEPGGRGVLAPRRGQRVPLGNSVFHYRPGSAWATGCAPRESPLPAGIESSNARNHPLDGAAWTDRSVRRKTRFAG